MPQKLAVVVIRNGTRGLTLPQACDPKGNSMAVQKLTHQDRPQVEFDLHLGRGPQTGDAELLLSDGFSLARASLGSLSSST
jgi:hypothetical protein